MKKYSALFLAIVLCTGTLIGCSGGAASSVSQDGAVQNTEAQMDNLESSNPANVEGESYKSDIRIGTLTDLAGANCYTVNSTVTTQTCKSTFNGLVDVDIDGNATPSLAIEWTSNDDSTEWTFKLREGVKFHDGSEFTAEDVKFTWDYASDITNDGIAIIISGAGLVDEVVVEDAYTVTFKLNSNAADWLFYAKASLMSKTAVERDGMEEGGKIGTGPYYLDNLETGVSWTLRRFEEYWGEKPISDTITFVVITDANARAMALRSGDVDAIYDGNMSDIASFMADDNYNVFSADNLQVVYAGFNAKSEYGDNPVVRQAVAMAINRDDIITACYEKGACATPVFNFISPVAVGYVDVEHYEYNPEAAKALLEENGLDGITLNLYTFAKFIPVAEIVQANLAAAGLNVNITEWSQTGFSASIKEDGNYDLAINDHAQFGGVVSIMEDFLHSQAPTPFMQYANPEFDAKLEDVLASATYDEMLEKFAGLQQYVADECPVVPICMAKIFVVGTDNFYGVNLNAQAIDINFSYCYVIES